MQTFYKRIKLLGYPQDVNETTMLKEGQIFKPPNHKKWTPNKNHNMVLTTIEAT